MIGKVLEITFVLVLAYLVLANAPNFSIAVQSVGGVYNGAVKTLQGRP
jgi:hypothetical protein